jgi:pyridoxal 5'-phosphate synthase pdxS subunit
VGLAEMLKGGVIMDVVNVEQARIAQEAGACAVMALERVPAQIRKEGGVARASDPADDQSHPGGREHPGDGQVPHRALHRGAHPRSARGRLHRRERGADARRRLLPHRKARLQVPFVCGCTELGEALRRIGEGAAMLRTKGEAGTGNIVEACGTCAPCNGHIRRLTRLRPTS